MKKTLDSIEILPQIERIINAALEKKAQDIVLMDLRDVSNYFNYFIIMSGSTREHVRIIAHYLTEKLEEIGLIPDHIEGLETSRWVLLDCNDLIVHIFVPEARSYYSLETLWGDAPSWKYEDENTKTED